MVYAGQMIRFFISSTFHDMFQERDALQKNVFPKLRELCREGGAHFQAIDLRWGVSQDASQDHRTLAICMEEIDRCRKVSPDFNFLILLGERHGSDLLPEQIDQDEFRMLLDQMSDDELKAIDPWYLLDHNAIPPRYVLQPRDKETYPTYKNWEPKQRYLHAILAKASKGAQLNIEAQVKYLASATELEIEEGVFRPPAKEQEVLCFFRTIEGVPHDGSAPLYIEQDIEKYDRLLKLKQRLKGRFPTADVVHEYTARWNGNGCSDEHISAFCNTVYGHLEVRIKAILEQQKQIPGVDLETNAFQQFAKQLTGNFVERDELVGIETYLRGAASYPLVVSGASGSGKSTLLAQAVKMARKEHSSAMVEEAYIGVTPDSSNIRSLLAKLCSQITLVYGGDVTTIPTDERGLIEELPRRLGLVSVDRPLFLFIDALDQLRESDQRTNWIPRTLPQHVRIVVSILPGSELDKLREDLPASQVLTLMGMTREQGDTLLTRWMEGAKRRLQSSQHAAILDTFATNGLPLYLRLAFEEARRWASYEAAPILPPDIPGLLKSLFSRLSEPRHHGKMLVTHTLGYLEAARNGLSEEELLDILPKDDDVLADLKITSPDSPAIDPKLPLPVVLWSRLFFDLNSYLTERAADGSNLIDFYHRQLGEVAKNMYLQGDDRLARHRQLAEYFKNQPLVNGSAQNLRKMSEMPFQQTEGELWDELYQTLTDFRFLEQKAATGMQERMNLARVVTKYFSGVYDLQRDFERAIGRWSAALK